MLNIMENSKNFTSYVGWEEHELQTLSDSSSRRNSLMENSVKLLAGEVVIAEAQNVLMFEPVGDLKQGISGVLFVTNFKLSFVTSSDNWSQEKEQDVIQQENHLYGYTETCLTNIEEIYVTMGDNKKRKLIPGNTTLVVPSKVRGIFIICKNLRTWSFSFKFSPIGHGKNLLTALLHHAFPSRHQLLFAYDYKQPYYNSTNSNSNGVDKNVRLFRDILDWQNELKRTVGCGSTREEEVKKKGWRLSSINEKFELCPSLSRYIVVPASVTDKQLKDVGRHFQGNRPPVWCWSNAHGAALVKMPELIATQQVTSSSSGEEKMKMRMQENIMFENVRKSHPEKLPPVVIELNNKEINVRSIGISYSKFVSLCSPENIRQFWIQDNNFYSLLENTKWLRYVSYCLEKAVQVCEHLNEGLSVILQEGAGRDLCCVVSSIVQISLDAEFRTTSGFQSLLQKEWVAGGHPFSDRLGHIVKSGSNAETERSPLFLLYLDCVWQLCQQYPSEFEFTETYLTTLWDTAHVSVFETFIFNCERDRVVAATDPNTPLVLRSVWDWGEQLSDRDMLLFKNPLFKKEKKEENKIKPWYEIWNLEVWTQCYFRWIPVLEIYNGGYIKGGGDSSLIYSVGSFYPFSKRRSRMSSRPIMLTCDEECISDEG